MKMATDALYLENLEEFVNDENKIVTYRWFSTNLQIHVNQAKQMLFNFVQDQRNKKDNDDLSVTYFVAGLTKPVNGQQVHKCTVVKEEDLEAYRSSLAVVTSSHIYSVQKAKLKDASALYSADYDAIKESNKYSAIRFSKAKMRSGAEIDSLRKVIIPQSTDNNKGKTNGAAVTNGQSNSKPTDKPSKPQQKGGIAGMFANAAKKAEAKKEEPKKEQEMTEQSVKPVNKPKTSGLKSFFTGAQDKKTEESKTTAKVKVEVKKSPSPKPIKQEETKRSKKTQRKADSDDENDNKKKRRRIKQDLFDSSSDEEEVEIEDDSPAPSPVRETVLASDSEEEMEVSKPSPKKRSPEKVVQVNRETGERKRKRRRKLVPKTFMDDDGYMVTEKVWESESTDASDVEPLPVTKETPKVQQKQSSPQKKTSPQKKSPPSGNSKQMSLTSFFKKK